MNRLLTIALVAGSLLFAAAPAAAQGDGYWEPYDDHAFDREPGERKDNRDGRDPHQRRGPEGPTYEISRPRSRFLAYWQDRFYDIQDLIRLRVGMGGFGFHARVTAAAQVGFLYQNGYMFGIDRRAMGVWHEERFQAGLSFATMTEITTSYRAGNEFADPTSDWNALYPRRGYVRNGEFFDDGRWRYLSCAAELHLGIIGLDVAVYPEELVDFILGFGMIDIFGDDLSTVYGPPDRSY
jgi:hypothetical protein